MFCSFNKRLFVALLFWFALKGIASAETYAVIAPLLNSQCVMCHSGKHAAAGLSLDSYEAVLKGGLNGKVVKSGDPDNSELTKRLNGTSQPRMPMTGPPYLSKTETDKVIAWIKAGLPRGNKPTTKKQASPQTPKRSSQFKTYLDVAPIFAQRCAKCHTENGRPPEGYVLTSYEATLSPRDRVRVIPGNAAASELYRRIKGYSYPRMPFDGPPYLSYDEIETIRRWIEDGARDSRGEKAYIPTGRRVRFEGRLESKWRVDGAELKVTRQTRIDKSPRPGDRVRVEGRVTFDGKVEVERIRRR